MMQPAAKKAAHDGNQNGVDRGLCVMQKPGVGDGGEAQKEKKVQGQKGGGRGLVDPPTC